MDEPLISVDRDQSQRAASQAHTQAGWRISISEKDHEMKSIAHSPTEASEPDGGLSRAQNEQQVMRNVAKSNILLIALLALLTIPPVLVAMAPLYAGGFDKFDTFPCGVINPDGSVFFHRDDSTWPDCNRFPKDQDGNIVSLLLLPFAIATDNWALFIAIFSSLVFVFPLSLALTTQIYQVDSFDESILNSRDNPTTARVLVVHRFLREVIAPSATKLLSDPFFKSVLTGFVPVIYLNLAAPIFIDESHRQIYLSLWGYYPERYARFFILAAVVSVVLALIAAFYGLRRFRAFAKKYSAFTVMPIREVVTFGSNFLLTFYVSFICFVVGFGGILILGLMILFPQNCNFGSLTFGKGKDTGTVTYAAVGFGVLLFLYWTLASWLSSQPAKRRKNKK